MDIQGVLFNRNRRHIFRDIIRFYQNKYEQSYFEVIKCLPWMCWSKVTWTDYLSKISISILFPESSEAKFWYQINWGHEASIFRRFSLSQLQFTHRWRTRTLLSTLRGGKTIVVWINFHFLDGGKGKLYSEFHGFRPLFASRLLWVIFDYFRIKINF